MKVPDAAPRARELLLALVCCAALTACLGARSITCEHGTVCPEGRCLSTDRGEQCIPAHCGNGLLDPTEYCDDGNNTPADGCPADCGQPCGDGYLDPGEACDDHNTVGGDGCSADCRSTEQCGNGIVDPGEACDDGNLQNHDGCSGRCALEIGEWTPTDRAPSPRSGHAMAYDAARGTTVMFGGQGLDGLLGDTWEWDGAVWRRMTSATSPPARASHAMAYDAAHGQVVLFGGGGSDPLSDLDDTWVWDGSNWTQKSPANRPGGRAEHAMAYDSAHGQNENGRT